MRWLFRMVGILVVVALVVVGAVLLLPGERIARVLADKIQTQTGRALTFDGKVSVTFWPVLGVDTGPVRLSDADWAGPEPMIEAKSMSIGVSGPDLLRGKLRVRKLVADDPVIRLRRRVDGRANWDFSLPTPPVDAPAPSDATGPAPATEPMAVALDRLHFTNARLIYQSEGSAPVDLGGVDLALQWPDPTGAAEFDLGLRPAGSDVTVAGSVGAFADFLGGKVAPVKIRANAAGGTVLFSGRANNTGDASGGLEVRAGDAAAMMAALGLGSATLPASLGPGVELTSQVTYTSDGRLSLRDMSLGLGRNTFGGAVDLSLSEPPQITARLTAGALDFEAAPVSSTAAGPGGGTPSDQAAAAAGWSKAAIDASALGTVNGQISLTAESLRAGGATLGASQVRLSIDRSRAVLELVSVKGYEGTLTGQLVANNRSGFSVGGDLTATGVEMKSFLRDMAGTDKLSGKGAARLKFLGVGGNLDAIMRSLSGSGGIDMGRGVIGGLDLDRLMRSGDAGRGTTVFDSLSASFSMTDGNLFNEDLLILLPNYRADGNGRIGLGTQDIDYVFTPVALRANSGEGLAIPVRIRGPWADPKIYPDVERAFKLELESKKDEIEQKAKDKLQEKLQEELDIAPVEGQSVEDALKGRLEDEVKRGLLKLLGRD